MRSAAAARLSQGAHYLPVSFSTFLSFPPANRCRSFKIHVKWQYFWESFPHSPSYSRLALSKHVSYYIAIISSHIPFENILNISSSYYCSSKTFFKYYDIMSMYHNVNV